MAQYQDIIKNGNVIKHGQRECESRYAVIKKHLEKYQRSFTVLDIGANLGYFSFRIAYDFPNATCIMIEDHYGNSLEQLCKENNLKNVIFLKKKVDAESLSKLSECEHFDVILALNVVHHIGNVDKTLDCLENLGDELFIETPHYLDEGSCGKEHLKNIYEHVTTKYNIVGSFSRHTSSKYNSIMGLLVRQKTNLVYKFWDSTKIINSNYIKINSNFETKTFHHIEKNEFRNWFPGINLRTYQYLNGQYPNREEITNLLDTLKIESHLDFTPWNIIISGKELNPIDIEDINHTKITNSLLQKEKIKKELLSGIILNIREYKS
jgi:2-polyprenyl-3-methyl-5-hydroxy-6-metoxy-1,4-benzoquinol methylase